MDNNIKDAVNKVGYELIEVASFPHKDDFYLRLLIAKNHNEYVCWLYNDSLKGLYEGYYCESYEQAENRMMEKLS